MPASRLGPNARALTLEIAAEARAEWGFASDLIARAFRAHRELSSGDRRLCSETVYGLIRMDRRLDAILEQLTDGAALAPHARDELKLLVYEARGGIPVEALAAEAKR
ncbi:MAG TPA: transcription antitermination factor NusB, partial [Polyangia bacterium]|nr:transcription antitermination factor NusB [Polyangia bacterium]